MTKDLPHLKSEDGGSIRVRSLAAAQVAHLTVQEDPLPDTDNPSLNLMGDGPFGPWAMRVPYKAFPVPHVAPGSRVTVMVGIQQIHVEDPEPGHTTPKLLLPGADLQ